MNIFIVSYDLNTDSSPHYDQLVEAIKSYQDYICLGGSAYLIETDESSVSVRDNLKAFLNSGDKLYVGRVTSPAAWFGMPEGTSKWIKEHL
ncbi:hypothetical protein [Bacteroides salyersiae]|jgi:phosphatidylserine/phosphatidylglycerophosphate/cardiolipin synthase-like enzyme|uniref:hypothetical protein n=1 Tax=Bacteroides salyersiae TaxID=291644 RepID=UPI001C8C6EDC|nr:hypothetical protein [Bacteroides salyersiae]